MSQNASSVAPQQSDFGPEITYKWRQNQSYYTLDALIYWFIISLAICDIVMVIISLVHLVPATAFHSIYVEIKSTRNIIVIFFYDLFWYAGVVQLGLMAINRFVSIVYPMEYKNIFSRSRALLLIALGYFLGFIASLPTLFDCCHTLWDSNNYITVYEKPETWYKYVDMAVNSISLLLMIFSYSVIIYKVRESGKAMAKYQLTIRSRQNTLLAGIPAAASAYQMNGVSRISSVRPPRSQVSKKEMRLFIQFFVVSLVFLLTWTTWQWLPYMSESKWAGFAMTSLFFINNSVNPSVYLIFNSQLRRELHYLLCRHRAVTQAQNKLKLPPFGKDIHINGEDGKHKVFMNEDGRSLIDQGASLSSHTTSDDQVRPQLMIKNMTFTEATTDITAV